MNNLYEYLVNNFKLNEPIILSNLKVDSMSYDNLRQQMKKLVDDGKVRRYENGVYYLPKPSVLNLDLGLNPETVLEYKYLIEDGRNVVIYITVNNGIILPKAAIGSQYEEFVKLV